MLLILSLSSHVNTLFNSFTLRYIDPSKTKECNNLGASNKLSLN
jgi:hypothetical protein